MRVSRETGEVAVRAVTEAGGRRCPSGTRSCMRPAVRSLAVGRESGSGRQNDFNIAGRTFYESRPMHQLSSCLLLLVTAHVKVCRLAYDISKPLIVFDRYSILEILTGDVFFVNLFCSILEALCDYALYKSTFYLLYLLTYLYYQLSVAF